MIEYIDDERATTQGRPYKMRYNYRFTDKGNTLCSLSVSINLLLIKALPLN